MLIVKVFTRFQSRTSYSSTKGVLERLKKHDVQVTDSNCLIITIGVKDFQVLRDIQADLKCYTNCSGLTKLIKNPENNSFVFDGNFDDIISMLKQRGVL